MNARRCGPRVCILALCCLPLNAFFHFIRVRVGSRSPDSQPRTTSQLHMTPSVFKDASALRPLLCCAFPSLQGEEALPLADCACAVRLNLLGPEVLRASISFSLLPLAGGSGGRAAAVGVQLGRCQDWEPRKSSAGGTWTGHRGVGLHSSGKLLKSRATTNQKPEWETAGVRPRTPETCILGAECCVLGGERPVGVIFLRGQVGLIVI